MTNTDYFRAFAADTTSKSDVHYFEHGREDFHNLFDADSESDAQVKMFHYTDTFSLDKNESGSVMGVNYRGSVLCLLKSDLDETIDVQKGVAQEDGKYEKRVKSLIDGGGILAEIIAYNACADNPVDLRFFDAKEIYNFMDFNGDGIWFKYEMYIRN